MTSEPRDLAALYEAHARRVWRMVARLGVPPAVIEDVVQEVFLTAHERLGQFEGRSSPETWLTGIAVRLAAKARRSRRDVVALSALEPDPAEGADLELERRRAMAQLERVLSQLPEDQREVVVLMDLEELTAPQVAEALEVKLNTVYSRLRLGRAALARALEVSHA